MIFLDASSSLFFIILFKEFDRRNLKKKQSKTWKIICCIIIETVFIQYNIKI